MIFQIKSSKSCLICCRENNEKYCFQCNKSNLILFGSIYNQILWINSIFNGILKLFKIKHQKCCEHANGNCILWQAASHYFKGVLVLI